MRISLNLDATTYECVVRQAEESGQKISALLLEVIMEKFSPPEVCVCAKCGKPFSIEADEGSIREEGAFCNRHIPQATTEE